MFITVSCITVSMCYMGTLIIRKIAPMIIPLLQTARRFPHTAADCYCRTSRCVCAGAGQRQHQNIILYAMNKRHPVRENMTFPMACPIAGQVMVTVLIRQRLAHCQQCYDLLQQLDLQAALDGSFVVFFETGRVLDGIFGFFHLFRSANNSSRSL